MTSMKKIYLFALLASLISISTLAQKRRGCNNPMSNFAFQQKFKNIQQQFNEANKLRRALTLVRNNCLTSIQVKEIALLFQTDGSRITFAQQAYSKTYNRNEFHHVYDAFKRFKNVAKVHEAIMQMRRGNGGSSGSGDIGFTGALAFPNWQYPSVAGYKGKNNCGRYLNNIGFTNYARQIHQQKNSNARYQRAWQIMTTNCMTTAQAMKFVSLIQQDSQRLELLKGAFKGIFDVGNYFSAGVALTNYNNQQSFDQFLKSKVGFKDDPSCLASDTEFNQIFSQIRQARFRSDKLKKAKTIFKIKKKCYSLNQIKKVVKELTFDQLDFAKFAYDYAHKKDDYYLLENSLSSYFDKQRFMKFLEQKRK